MMVKQIKESAYKAGKAIFMSLPILIGIFLLISLMDVFIPKEIYGFLFRGSFLDFFIGSSLGSIFTGNPLTSYVIGSELRIQGVGLIAVTSFMVSWVTVGLIQFPAEAILLGKKFAILRNVLAFFFAIIVGVVTVLIFNYINPLIGGLI